ncbi:uncharacterized protein LOC115622971 [Scaptodrosophila lebanonensis]|uniref:Uncharacterized protein LOC115622971 n=1 Tax=Drosophila lebanonensis TaxID=7225 RepID=A0A6J2TDB8_DROLE|nr:uncharacterized protein LOC115622971 [Scaptodrosophila lebanonensis]
MAAAEAPIELPDRCCVSKRQFWREFLALYESLPELWDARNLNYRHRDCKYEAYDVLQRKLQELEPNATRYDVQRRINIFRTNYRRERLRILKQQSLGVQSDVVKPTLWFYDFMSFLLTQETFQHGTRTRKIRGMVNREKTVRKNNIGRRTDFEGDRNWTFDEATKNSFKPGTVVTKLDDKPLLSPKIEIFEPDFVAAETTMHIDDMKVDSREPTMLPDYMKEDTGETSASDYNEPTCSTTTSTIIRGNTSLTISEGSEALAKSWAIQYEEMAPTQRILARKAIADILFEGCMGNLRINRGVHNSVGNQL